MSRGGPSRFEQVDHWVKTALGQHEPVIWTNALIAARVEIEDLHWVILSGIARGGSIVANADR
jgi:hypothetical protein